MKVTPAGIGAAAAAAAAASVAVSALKNLYPYVRSSMHACMHVRNRPMKNLVFFTRSKSLINFFNIFKIYLLEEDLKLNCHKC